MDLRTSILPACRVIHKIHDSTIPVRVIDTLYYSAAKKDIRILENINVEAMPSNLTMLTKIKRQVALNDFPVFPTRDYDIAKDEEITTYPKVKAQYVLSFNSKTFAGHINMLVIELKALLDNMEASHLVFLGDTKTAWLCQKNDYMPVKKAEQFLIDNKIGRRFNGAIKISKQNIPTFIKHLSWLTRTNALLPYIYFTDNGQNLLGNICQYGNLHLSILNDQTITVVNNFLINSKVIDLKGSKCNNQFNKTNKIRGRQIIV